MKTSCVFLLLVDLLYNFNKVTEKTDGHGEEYDYGSIMHYPLDAFAVNPAHQTLIPLRSLNGKVPYVKLSDSDVTQANRMYKCMSENIMICNGSAGGSL